MTGWRCNWSSGCPGEAAGGNRRDPLSDLRWPGSAEASAAFALILQIRTLHARTGEVAIPQDPLWNLEGMPLQESGVLLRLSRGPKPP
jgi:hypothetical protein